MKTYLAAIAFLVVSFAPRDARAQERTATVISEGAGLYARPSDSEKKQQSVAVLTRVKVLDQEGGWYVVRVLDRVGWMPGHSIAFPGSSAAGGHSSSLLGASVTRRPAASASSRTYIRGPRGGCYYLTASGNKQYVDRSLCS